MRLSLVLATLMTAIHPAQADTTADLNQEWIGRTLVEFYEAYGWTGRTTRVGQQVSVDWSKDGCFVEMRMQLGGPIELLAIRNDPAGVCATIFARTE